MSYKNILFTLALIAWTIIAVRTVSVVRHTWVEVNAQVDSIIP